MKALIFDMDGVIIDSEYHWNYDEEKFLEQAIPGWTHDDLQNIIGLNIHDTYKKLKKEYNLEMPQESFLEEVKRIADRIYQEKCNLIPGFSDLIKELKAMGVPLGLASSSIREWIDIAIKRFDLDQAFSVIVSAEEIEGEGKPAPDIYIHTAKILGVAPTDCGVIEDSKNGVLSAKGANMFCMGFRNGFNQSQDLSKADIEIHGYDEKSIQQILNFLKA